MSTTDVWPTGEDREALKPNLKRGHLGSAEPVVRPTYPRRDEGIGMMRVSLWRALRAMMFSAALVLFLGFFNTPAAYAADFDLEIPGGAREGDPGTLLTLATQQVDPEFQGRQCSVVGEAFNQHSVHPNSDLFVQSGGTEVVLRDVESAPNVTVEGEGTLTLGEEIVVVLRFGEDGIFSAGMTVKVDCPESSGIVVIKEVTEGSSTTQDFEFSASYVSDGFSLSDGEQHDSGPLEPGEYSLSENVPDGWELESAVCDDNDSTPPEINLLAGEIVTCIFTNDELPEVAAAIVVTVAGDCEVVAGEPVGVVTVSIPIAGGAEVVVRDSEGGVVGTFTEDARVEVPEGQYTWEATAGPGFEFPEGFESTGSFIVVCEQVRASILITVSEKCELVGSRGVGRITVTMSVSGAADVVVRDSAGEVVGSLSADGTITVPEGDRYTWEATLAEGFELPPGQADSGTLNIATCSALEVLPFTGSPTDGMGFAGLVMLLMGGVTLLMSLRIRDDS